MSTQLLAQPARTFSLRLLGLILALVVAGGLASASHLKAAKASDAIELTYTKWFAPHYPLMTGVVGGDIVGSFGGYVISRTLSADGRFVLLEAQYEVHRTTHRNPLRRSLRVGKTSRRARPYFTVSSRRDG